MENLSNNKRTTPEPNRFSYTNISEDQKYELGDNLSLINWASEKLEPFQKNFYIVFFYNCFIFLLKEHESVKNRSPAEVQKFRSLAQITVFGKNVPNPVENFEESQFPKYTLDAIKAAKFSKPTPIQSQCIFIYFLKLSRLACYFIRTGLRRCR